jgi:hypothetical protein
MAKHITLLLILAVAPLLQSNNLLVDEPFDFEQMQQDAAKIEASEVPYHFDFQNPKHKYFLVINTLDVASTIYAIENRDNLSERNPLLSKRPELEELILQKAIVIYTLNHLGLFSTHPDDQPYFNVLNIIVTAAVINNLHRINTND